MPLKMKERAVNIAIDKPVKMGLDRSIKQNRTHKTLITVVHPQLLTPSSLSSKEKPRSKKERNKSVKPTTKERILIESPG